MVPSKVPSDKKIVYENFLQILENIERHKITWGGTINWELDLNFIEEFK